MSLSTLSIKRHALTWAVSLGILLLGVFSYKQVGLDRLPEVEFPVLVVFTSLPGASPETVATAITAPLEGQLNTIAGIDSIDSRSSKGVSTITLNFKLETSLAEAYSDVQAKIGAASRVLPEEADTPVIFKFDVTAAPVAYLALSGAGFEQKQLAALATEVKKKLETIAGVGEIRLNGNRDEQLQIVVNESKLNSLGLTYSDIKRAFVANHLNLAGGTSKTKQGYFSTNLNFEFETPESLGELQIAQRDGVVVRLKHVADVRLAEEDVRSFAKFKGEPAVGLAVIKISGGNSLALVEEVTSRLPQIQSTLPAGVSLEFASETTGPIKDLVATLKAHLVEGTLLTALVVFIFLRSTRATLIIASAIPISLAGSVAGIYLLGFTLNSMTLLALLLLIGVVVDDAIVVLESIVKKREINPGISAYEAAKAGANEVFFAVMASTLTLVAIFVPILFLPGILGRFFESLAAVVVIGVLVSWFVSLTLTPMLCSRYLGKSDAVHKEGPLLSKLESGFLWLEAKYAKSLEFSMRFKKTTILIAFLSLLPALYLAGGLPKGFSPESNEGRVVVRVSVPLGSAKEYLEQKLVQVGDVVAKTPEVATYFLSFSEGGRNGADSGNLFVSLSPERTRTQVEVLAALNKDLSQITGVKARAFANTGSPGGSGSGSLQFVLLASNYDALVVQAKEFERKLKDIQGLESIDASLSDKDLQLDVVPDRVALGQYGVNAQDLTDTISAANGQNIVGRYTANNNERYAVVMMSKDRLRPDSPEELGSLKVRSQSGELVQIDRLAKLNAVGVATSIERSAQQFAIQFSGQPSVALGEAVDKINALASELPAGFSVVYKGQAVEFQKTGKNLGYVLLAALVCLYLVLASQFNNFSQPFIVMAAQPLAVVGGLGALAVSGQGLNIYSMIGLILLLGLVAKNSILLVDRFNQLLEENNTKWEAALLAGPERLRPVLMTSLTLILALLPAALGYGAGAENNAPLSMAIVGGMVSSTILTLYVVPSLLVLRSANKS